MPEKPPDPGPDPRRAAVLGLIVTLVLVVLGYVLVKVLGDSSRLQDCAMSGRTNCDPVSAPNGDSQ